MKGIRNGLILLKDRILTGHSILYTNVIEDIVPNNAVPAEAEIMDAQGGYIVK